MKKYFKTLSLHSQSRLMLSVCFLLLTALLAACGSLTSKPMQTNHLIDKQSSNMETSLESYKTRFVPSASGEEVVDNKTGLVWLRCSLGQKWEGGKCTGAPEKLSIKDVENAIKKVTQPAGNWRLPTARELSGLVLCTSGKAKSKIDIGDGQGALDNVCHGQYQAPTTDAALFPVDGLEWYWSSTTKQGGGKQAGENSSEAEQTYAQRESNQTYYVHFLSGLIGTLPEAYTLSVRLVRNK